jgi:polar amino acid transport system substrate-binding protein
MRGTVAAGVAKQGHSGRVGSLPGERNLVRKENHMMRSIVSIVPRTVAALAFAVAVFTTSVDMRDATAQTPSNVVYVGTSLTLAPFSFINEKGENVGFEVDVLKAIGERLGYQFQFVRVPFSQNFTSLNAGIFRVSASSAFMTCERLKNPKGVGRFSVPTYSAGQAISTRIDLADKIKSIEDLKGLKVGIESVGSTADRVITEAGKKIQFEKLVFPDNPSLFLALEQGRVDAAVQGEFSAIWQMRDNPKMKIAARIPDTYFPVGFVFRDGDPMRDQFNKVINEMKTDGTLVKIYREWFKSDPAPDSPTGKVVPEVTAESRGC